METKILEEIGLTDSEIKVYLALLKLGGSKKGPIVREARITSSKVYEVIDRLIEKGLASSVIKNKVMHFKAAPPSRIKDYLREKEKNLKKQGAQFDKILPQLLLAQNQNSRNLDAEIFYGWKGMQTVYNDLLNSLKKGDEYFIFGASKGEDEEKVRNFFNRFNLMSKNKGIVANIIFNENARGNIKNIKQNAQVRYLEQTTPSEILIYQDKTAIVLLEKEPLIILITGKSIAKSFKEYFKVMWKISKK